MIFYRSEKGATDRSVAFVRAASLASLLAYPAGALTLALGQDSATNSIIGYGLVLFSILCAALLTGSTAQRIVGEEAKLLDEFELTLRYRTMGTAYAVFSTLALGAAIYAAIAADKGGWLPTTYEHYNGVFWGIFLYAFTLPTACLAWLLDPSAEQAS